MKFRTFIVLSIAIGLILIGWGFTAIHNQQVTQNTLERTLHTLVVYNQNTLSFEGETKLHNAETRIVTVGQRCELTQHGLKVAAKIDPSEVNWYRGSLKGCEMQLAKLEKEAVKAKATDSPGGGFKTKLDHVSGPSNITEVSYSFLCPPGLKWEATIGTGLAPVVHKILRSSYLTL